MAVVAAFPAVIAAMVTYWLGKPRRIIVLVALITFVIALLVLIALSWPLSGLAGEPTFETLP